MDSMLEPDYQPAWDAWQKDQTPVGNAAFLKAINPIVEKGVRYYAGNDPLASSQGKLLALEAAKKYDPSKARLQSHILSHMQGLKRIDRDLHAVVSVPERILHDSAKLREFTQELTDRFGREPTDDEIMDNYGISRARLAKIRSYQPGMSTGQAEAINPEEGGIASKLPGDTTSEDLWLDIVYQDLGTTDKKILEYTLGLNGQPKLSNQEIAAKLGRSPGAITQRKVRIQQLLDQEQQLSPFI